MINEAFIRAINNIDVEAFSKRLLEQQEQAIAFFHSPRFATILKQFVESGEPCVSHDGADYSGQPVFGDVYCEEFIKAVDAALIALREQIKPLPCWCPFPGEQVNYQNISFRITHGQGSLYAMDQKKDQL